MNLLHPPTQVEIALGSTNSIVSCSKSHKGSLWRDRACLSVPGTYDLHVPFDVGVGSKPGFISNQNTRALVTNEQPQTMHVSELLEQIKDSRDVVCIRCSQVVVSLANQFFTLIPNKLTEIVRNFNVPPVAVYYRDIAGRGATSETSCERMLWLLRLREGLERRQLQVQSE